MAVIVQDSFTRADSTSVLGAPTIGPSPTIITGTWGISSNQAYPSAVSTNQAIAVWECSTTNVDITMKRPSSAISGGIFFGAVSATDGWYAYFNAGANVGDESYIGRFSGQSSIIPVVFKGKNGPFITTASLLRLIHYNGWVEMWSDSTLVLRALLPEVITSTKHGIRLTATTQRADDLTISDAPDISIPTKTGQIREPVYATQTLVLKDSFVYRGRDTKSQDTTGVA